MKLKKIIEIDLVQEGTKGLSCGDGAALILLFGSQSVIADKRLYGITKKDNRYYFSMDTFKKRLVVLKRRAKKWQDRVDMVNSVMEQLEEDDE